MFQSKTSDAPSQTSAAPTQPRNNAQTHTSNANAASANCSIINEWLVMRGDLESAGDILVRGRVIGNIQCKMLIVDADAVIDGGILADEAVIRGTTKGIIRAQKVRVERTADVEGHIFQESFAAEEGARIRGALRAYDEVESGNHMIDDVSSADVISIASEHAPTSQSGEVAKAGGAFYQRLGAARAAHAASTQ